MKEEESLLMHRLEELADRSFQRGIPCASEFLNLNEQSVFHALCANLSYCIVRLEGGFPTSERKKAFFFPADYPSDAQNDFIEEEICCLYAEPLQKKFADALTHRDFLGAVLNLGIDRSRIGDIFVRDQLSAYYLLDSSIGAYVSDNLTRVKHTTVKTSLASHLPEDFTVPVEPLRGSVASLRVDALAAFAFKLSRQQAASAIREERVFVQGRLVRNGSETVKPGQIVSLRGSGRFRFEGVRGETRKERFFVEVSMYR